MIKLSIIALYYNQYNEFVKLYNSILYSNLDSYELIIIDDGSSESEYTKLNNLIVDNSNVKIIRFANNTRNQSFCRNIGLKIAKGKYITYIDGDDYYIPTYFNDVYKNLSDDDVYLTTVLTENRYNSNYYSRNIGIKMNNPSICICQIIAKRSFIIDNDIYWEEEKYNWDAEDLYYGILLLSKTEKYTIIDKEFYMHKKFTNSNSERNGDAYYNYSLYLLEMHNDLYDKIKNCKYYDVFNQVITGTVSGVMYHVN